MRMNIALIVISLMVLSAGIVCVTGMHTCLEELTLEAQTASSSIPHDLDGAKAALERFSGRWEEVEDLWQLFAIHEDLDGVKMALMRAYNALEAGDTQEAATACDELLLSLEEIHQKEVPSAGNIF